MDLYEPLLTAMAQVLPFLTKEILKTSSEENVLPEYSGFRQPPAESPCLSHDVIQEHSGGYNVFGAV